jgi:hypothetical protein
MDFPDKNYLPCLYQFSRKKCLDKHVQQPMRKKGWPSFLSLSETIWVQASSDNVLKFTSGQIHPHRL